MLSWVRGSYASKHIQQWEPATRPEAITAMPSLLILLAIVVPLLVGGAFVLGRLMRDRRRDSGWELTPVSRQHLEIYQGGSLDDEAVHLAKLRYQDWLDRGEIDRIEASLSPGMQFIVRVRALAEIGTEEACQILQRQLSRRLTTNRIEQAWYWIDLANCLRHLNHEDSVPLLLECVNATDEFPLVHHFAAETIAFISFAGYLRDLESPLGEAALRLLHRAVEGMRFGVPLSMVIEARLGELVEALWDHKPEQPHALLVRLCIELRRQLKRVDRAEGSFGTDNFELETFTMQMSRILALEGHMEEYLRDAGPALARQVAEARGQRQRDLFQAIYDLRFDASDLIRPLVLKLPPPNADQGMMCLRWCRNPETIAELCTASQQVMQSRAKPRPGWQGWLVRRPPTPISFPYRALLYILREFPSPETEQFLLHTVHDPNPHFRATALGSFCWSEPYHRAEVLMQLQEARFDPVAEVRHSARTALARLGERQALQWFKQALCSDNRQCVFETIQTIAHEGLTLLWPDLDRLVDVEEPDLAFCASEALELMQEDLDYRLNAKSTP